MKQLLPNNTPYYMGLLHGACFASLLRRARFVSLLLALLMLAGCKSQRAVPIKPKEPACLSSKVELTVPTKNAVFTVGGTMKLVSGERMQLSFLMPILRSEVARLEVTPDELLMVDRMGKRYTRINRSELKGLLPRKVGFEQLEKMLFKASQPGAKRKLTGKDLGIPSLEKGAIELYDFSTQPFTLAPTELSSRYKEVPPEELLEMLISIQQ